MGNTIARAVASRGRDPVAVTVNIGETKESGTDNDIIVRFTDTNGKKSQNFTLDNFFKDDFEKGNTDLFFLSDVSEGLGEDSLGEICDLEIWREESVVDDNLFIYVIKVERMKTSAEHIFPIHRWIPMGVALKLRIYDAYLPQDEPFPEQRKQELDVRRELFKMIETSPGTGPTCMEVPLEHSFFTDHPGTFDAAKLWLLGQSKIKAKMAGKLTEFEDLKKLYSRNILPESQPSYEKWYWRDDYFGEQRVAGCHPSEIELCTEIPEKFAVTEQMLEAHLEGKSIADAINEKRLFLLDYKIVEGLERTNHELVIVAPMALLYRDNEDTLRPVAIQLQQVPSDDNPVFLPDDSPYLWLLVKMWFNMAEGCVHQAREHYSFAHCVMEALCLAVNRNLSPSHPVFRLLAPHFIQVLAINKLARELLVSPGGAMDTITQMGHRGALDVVRRSKWNMTWHGNPRKSVEKRGVGKDALPHYPYRDDAISSFDVIKEYVSEVINGVYPEGKGLKDDHEIQGWYTSLLKPLADGGVGIEGVPGDGKEATLEDLIEIVTVIIFTSSVQHAAVNFTQYEQSSSPFIYPSVLIGKPPTNKEALTEGDVMAALPHTAVLARHLVVTKVLCQHFTKGLGDFDIQYSYHPLAVAAQEKFRQNIKQLREELLERFAKRKYPYSVLDPNEVPNSISI